MTSLKEVQKDVDMDMTPMIDCVFLLMIFFVLVIDLSQQDLEDLILPKAQYQVPDDDPPDNRPVVNIVQDGRVVYKGIEWYDPKVNQTDYTEMFNLLMHFKTSGIAKDITTENLGGKNVEVVNDPILIRADKWTEWHYIGKLMEQCGKPQAAFWKLELAMSEEDKELKMMKNR